MMSSVLPTPSSLSSRTNAPLNRLLAKLTSLGDERFGSITRLLGSARLICRPLSEVRWVHGSAISIAASSTPHALRKHLYAKFRENFPERLAIAPRWSPCLARERAERWKR